MISVVCVRLLVNFTHLHVSPTCKFPSHLFADFTYSCLFWPTPNFHPLFPFTCCSTEFSFHPRFIALMFHLPAYFTYLYISPNRDFTADFTQHHFWPTNCFHPLLILAVYIHKHCDWLAFKHTLVKRHVKKPLLGCQILHGICVVTRSSSWTIMCVWAWTTTSPVEVWNLVMT